MWTQISYSYPHEAHLKTTTNVCLSQKGETCCEIARGQFSKITETPRLMGWEFAADKGNTAIT